MENVALIFIIVAAVFLVLGIAALRVSKQPGAITAIASVAMVLSVVGAVESTGWHRPAWMAWRVSEGESYEVLAYRLVGGEVIYLYLSTDIREPRPLVLGWDDDLADELRKESEESADSGGVLMYRHSFGGKQEFYSAPPPIVVPPKRGLPQSQHYERGA